MERQRQRGREEEQSEAEPWRPAASLSPGDDLDSRQYLHSPVEVLPVGQGCHTTYLGAELGIFIAGGFQRNGKRVRWLPLGENFSTDQT